MRKLCDVEGREIEDVIRRVEWGTLRYPENEIIDQYLLEYGIDVRDPVYGWWWKHEKSLCLEWTRKELVKAREEAHKPFGLDFGYQPQRV